jgi:hypothetical protein
VEWLGMIIEEGKTSMDPRKLKGISEWPSPTMVKQVRGFLGFGNFFYRHFIKHFSEIAKPLNNLLKKDQKFEWTTSCLKHVMDYRNVSPKNPSLPCQIIQSPSKSNATHQSMHQERSLPNWIRMATDTRVLSSLNLFTQLKEIMKSMITNYWQLSEPWKSGVTISKDHHTQQPSSQTIKT